MTRITLRLASCRDDFALRKLVAETPMAGRISLSFLREPSYFDALNVEGDSADVIVASDERNNIVAMGNRSFKNIFIDNQKSVVGYLSGLRVAPQYRNGSILFRGYRFLKDLDRDRKVRYYLSTIIEDNENARRALAGRRKGMPIYHDLGRYYTMALSIRQPPRTERNDDFMIRAASPDDIEGVIQFLSTEGGGKQFFPVYERPEQLLKGLGIEDILLAFHKNELYGVAAVWDQSAFRQIVVRNYAFPLKQLRPVYNIFAPPLGLPSFPQAGSQLSCLCLSLVCTKDNDCTIFRALLQAVFARYGSREAVLLSGFHERDPLLSVVRQYRHITYASRAYSVYWDGDEEQLPLFDESKIPYLEIGAL